MHKVEPSLATRRLTAAAVALASCTALALAAPDPASAASNLRCWASMSNAHPRDYATTDVNVRTNAAGAGIRTTAHYRTTNTNHTTRSDRHGLATVPYRISRATPGFKVKVSVTVKFKKKTATCGTSFTPV